MPKQTQIDLNLVDTKELIQELANRHEEIIVIREERLHPDMLNIRVKTSVGLLTKPELGFDIICALQLLHTAEEHLILDYLGVEQDGNDAPQDADSGP